MTDQEFFSQLFQQEYGTLLTYARKMLSLHGTFVNTDDAEDAVQETLILAWKKSEEVRQRENPGAWLMEAVKYVLLHMIRDDRTIIKRLAAVCVELNPNDHFPAPGASLELEGITTPENLLLLREFYLDGETYETLCLKYNLKKSALAMRLRRAKEDFKKNYEKIDEPSELSAKSGNVLREGGVGNEK